jgi:hypothetical protein
MECGQWVTDDYEYKKNEDGTDIKWIIKNSMCRLWESFLGTP